MGIQQKQAFILKLLIGESEVGLALPQAPSIQELSRIHSLIPLLQVNEWFYRVLALRDCLEEVRFLPNGYMIHPDQYPTVEEYAQKLHLNALFLEEGGFGLSYGNETLWGEWTMYAEFDQNGQFLGQHFPG